MQKKMPHSFRKVSVSESPFLNRLILPAPVDGVLADYFLAAAEAIAERGITLDFGSAEELLKTNTDNRDSWNPLVPMYDFRVNRLDASNLIVVLGRDNTGKVVTANAIRRYDWSNTHFITEASSLRLMYDEPETMKRLNEECLISAANAHVVTGQTAFSGAAWVHPDWRHAGLGGLLPVLIKVLGIGMWPTNCVFGMMSEHVYRRGFATRFGFECEDWVAEWRNSNNGSINLAVLWASRAYIHGLATHFLRDAAAEINPIILKRNAE